MGAPPTLAVAVPIPASVAVPSLPSVALAILVVVSALLRWLSLSGEVSPAALLAEYRDGKRSVEEAER